ncbi:hypothetical protein PoB_006415600 [Plakobranchus ocellatus]|uniref:Uncharacterized protein n=1 Tax=Plakobranchus ocellatus TaxID=259542 RepID=A0AAV4D0Z3_9GAST|nr:hypothetical protein PoB_006415600 [Plakobranchus ocellatus]
MSQFLKKQLRKHLLACPMKTLDIDRYLRPYSHEISCASLTVGYRDGVRRVGSFGRAIIHTRLNRSRRIVWFGWIRESNLHSGSFGRVSGPNVSCKKYIDVAVVGSVSEDLILTLESHIKI